MPSVEMKPIAPSPLRGRARALVLILILELIGLYGLGIYSYITLPDLVPTRFDFDGKPTSYGGRSTFLILSLAFSWAPLIILIITGLRFTLINRYPYLLSLPAFYTHLYRLPYEERGRWVNRYFEALSALGIILTLYLFFIELSIYQASFLGRLPRWFLPSLILLPIVFVTSFVYYLRNLSRKMKEAVDSAGC